MVQPIDFGQFYNPLYLFISLFGVICIVALIYTFGLKTILAKKDAKVRKSKKSARAAASKQTKAGKGSK